MAKSASIRLILSVLNDAGEEASSALDKTLTLSGFNVYRVERVRLAAAAADQPVTFTNAIGLILYSHDTPFRARLVAGQALLANARLIVLWADDDDDQIHSTSVLLTGNGTTPSDVEVWVVEKP